MGRDKTEDGFVELLKWYQFLLERLRGEGVMGVRNCGVGIDGVRFLKGVVRARYRLLTCWRIDLGLLE